MTRWHPAPRHECSLQEPDDEREGDEARGLDPLGTLRWRKSWSSNEDEDGEQDDEGSNEDYGIGPSENLKRSWWCNQFKSLSLSFKFKIKLLPKVIPGTEPAAVTKGRWSPASPSPSS